MWPTVCLNVEGAKMSKGYKILNKDFNQNIVLFAFLIISLLFKLSAPSPLPQSVVTKQLYTCLLQPNLVTTILVQVGTH